MNRQLPPKTIPARSTADAHVNILWLHIQIITIISIYYTLTTLAHALVLPPPQQSSIQECLQ